MSYKHKAPSGWYVDVEISSNASKNEIKDEVQGRLKIRIQKPREKGKANKELIRFLSKEWKVAKRNITIINGEKASKKRIHIDQETF